MANMSWTKHPDTVAQDYDVRHGRNLSSSLFRWATFVVEELYYLDNLDSDWNNDLNPTSSHHPDVIDMAHGRWATGSAITALDLCAAALGRQYCDRTGHYELDLRGFDRRTKQTLTLLVNSPHPRFHALGAGFIEGNDWFLASFDCRLQRRFSERFCINQQSQLWLDAGLFLPQRSLGLMAYSQIHDTKPSSMPEIP